LVGDLKKTSASIVILYRLFVAENYRRRSVFDEVAFVFPNAPNIPITLVRLPNAIRQYTDLT